MKVAKRGIPYIIGFGGAALFFYIVKLNLIALPFFLAALFSLWFFRDPEREIPPVEGFLSPADGRVIKVERRSDEEVGENCLYVSIFMSAFDVHVNRAPEGGRILKVQRTAGRFKVAYADEAEFENERNEIVVEMKNGEKYKMVQIAGALARRIYFYKSQGDEIKRGERVGLIAFGSRVDVFFPPHVQPLVEVGDKVLAGESIIAR